MIKINVKNNKGFVILFAVMLSSIILAITLGVTDIAFREIKFSTSAKNANEAFFAADTGTECALLNDKSPSQFPLIGQANAITCALNTVTPTFSGTPNTGLYSFIITGLGSTNTGCAKVSVKKDNTNPATIITTIISKGYNMGDGSCNSTSSNLVERELKTTYGGSMLPPGSCDVSFPNDQFHVCYFDGILAPTNASTALSQSTETAVSSPTGTWSGFNHDWSTGEVDSSGKSDQVSGVWRGRINFQAGNYTFHTTSDDGVELNIEGFGNVISNWTDHGQVQDNSAIIAIPAGYRDVQLRFYESGGGAVVGLWWDAAGWTFCADEGGTCSFPGTRQVRYGANSSYNYLNATNSIVCDNTTFGDPIVGTAKHCDY